MTTSTVALADFCQIVPGGRDKLTGADFTEVGYPAYGAGGINGYLPTAEFREPAVVVSSIGARCGKCFLAEEAWSSLANTQAIFPAPDRCDVRFLWHQLNDESRWHRSGTAQPFIKTSDIKSHRVYLPGIEEQLRIASVLDKADELRTKRRAALAELDFLTEAIFLGIFGDPSIDWQLRELGELAAEGPDAIRTGPFGSQLLHSEFSDEGVAVLGIDNVVQDRFVWAKPRFITPEKYSELRRFRVRPGDVLITIMGTCGRSAVVPPDVPLAITTKHLCCISLDQSTCLPEYLTACLRYDAVLRHQLGASERGAVMPGLNMGLIKTARLRVPKIERQLEFDLQRRAAEAIGERLQRGADLLDDGFASLHRRAFRGDL